MAPCEEPLSTSYPLGMGWNIFLPLTYLREGPGNGPTLLVNLWATHDLCPTLEEDEGGQLLGEG